MYAGVYITNATVQKEDHLMVPELPKEITRDGQALLCISGDTVSDQVGITNHECITDLVWVVFRDG